MIIEIEPETTFEDVALIKIVADSLRVTYYFDQNKFPINIKLVQDQQYLYEENRLFTQHPNLFTCYRMAQVQNYR